MAMLVPDQGEVTLGSSQISPADTYVRQTPQDVSSGFNALAKALGIYADNEDTKKYKEDFANKEVHLQRLRSSLNGAKPTDDDVNNILSDVHYGVRSRLSEDLGYMDALEKGSEFFKDMPFTLAPEEAASAFDRVRGIADQEAGGANLSYRSGYQKALNQMIAQRAQVDNAARIEETRKTTVKAMGTGLYNQWNQSYDTFKSITVGSATQQEAVKKVAETLGIDPRDLAAVISYETGGTMNPAKRGGMNKDGTGAGTFLGLIQFSPENQQRYGVNPGQSFEEQMAAVGQYLKDRGVKPGMGLMDVYSAINAGAPGLYDRSDVNGSVRSHSARIAREHYSAAEKFLGMSSSSDPMAAKVGISGKPLTPYQMMLRQDWLEQDAEYQKTSIVERGVLRDEAAKTLVQLAYDKQDPGVLDAIPDEALTLDWRDKFRDTTKNIIAGKKSAEDAAWQEAERQRTTNIRKAEREINLKILAGQKTLSPDEIAYYSNIDKGLVDTFNKNVSEIPTAMTSQKDQEDSLRSFYAEVEQAAAQGKNLDQISMDKIVDPKLREEAYKFVDKMKVEGGERGRQWYQEAWSIYRQNLYEATYGGAVKITANPALNHVEFTFKHELNKEISKFVVEKKRLPNDDDERYDIFSAAADRVTAKFPPKTVLAGREGGFGRMNTESGDVTLPSGNLPKFNNTPDAPKAPETQPQTPFKQNPDGSIQSPFGTGRLVIGPDGRQIWVKDK